MRRVILPVVLVALLATACGSDPRTGNAGATSSAAGGATLPADTTAPVATASPEQVATAPEALQFSAPVVGGGELDLRAYAGQTVAFWFWAPT